MDCVQTDEPQKDTDLTWEDNYICFPHSHPYIHTWSDDGPIDGLECIEWEEPFDSEQWNNNYLCHELKTFAWSSDGDIPEMYCTQIGDSDEVGEVWNDNHFCSSRDLGMIWSDDGIPTDAQNLDCVQITEPSESEEWNNNYLCLPTDSQYTLSWSHAGPIDDMDCVAWSEDNDEDGWNDNHLCWERR